MCTAGDLQEEGGVKAILSAGAEKLIIFSMRTSVCVCLCNVMQTQHGVCLDKQAMAGVVCEIFSRICL